MIAMNVLKQNSRCSRFPINLILGAVLLVFSCSKNQKPDLSDKYALLASYFEDAHNHQLDESSWGIVVISNRGCITCNRKFADFMAQQNENSNLIYIITASSSAIDISPFINMNSKFVFFDERNKIGKLSLLEGSGFIFLGDQQIDTVIEIKANQIESRFDFISNRLTKAVK